MSRASRKTKPTPSSNKHVFEPFSRRIARLRIDPVHTVRGRSAVDETSDLSQSYFRTALDEWSSLNLTVTFTSFLRSASPLSENLPQLLHHADAIFNFLVQHIEKKDHLALEPLLDLTAHFAHDLGQEFEKYFGRTVSLVASVAASHDRPDVVEWSFTCLAWMFKYLSRLLVQDLRPLLKVFRPYLSARKEHVSRFSAESLAFLIRKAAISYPKRKAPLTLALNELLEEDVISLEDARRGAKTLLVESCLGVDTQLHSGAEHLVNCLIELAAASDIKSPTRDVTQGFLVGLLHDTDSTSFEPVVRTAVEFSQQAITTANVGHMDLATDLLRTIIGTRNGARLSDWGQIPAIAAALCETSPQSLAVTLLPPNQIMAALTLQYAPMDQLLPVMNRLLDASTKRLAPMQFFSYCTLMADLGKDRFQQLLLPRLQQYLVHNFAENEPALAFALDQLHDRGVIAPLRSAPGFLESSRAWDEKIQHTLSSEEPALSPDFLARVYTLPKATRFPVDSTTSQAISEAIQRLIVESISPGDDEVDLRRRMCLGWLFEAYLAISPSRDQVTILWQKLAPSLQQYLSLLPFVRACNLLTSTYSFVELTDPQSLRVVDTLISNLLVQDLSFREQCLLLLENTGQRIGGPWLQQSLELLLVLLRTPYLPSNARAISMQIRRLPQLQKACPEVASLQALIPYFCLGMLPYYHDQCRKDLSVILGEMVSNTALEDTVLDVLTLWLRTPEEGSEAPAPKHESPQRSSRFQDSNLLQIVSITEQVCELYADPIGRTITAAEEAHRQHPVRPPQQCRSLALSAMSEMVGLVERRSRLLTPIFLAAQFTRTVNDGAEHTDSSDSSDTLTPDGVEAGWTLPTRKTFVKLIAAFQNPKVLFRSVEVYEKLVELLCNGNAEIRKQALIGILKWKNAILLKHESVFMKIVDEKIPSTEIGIMLNTDSEENPIKPEDRATVLPILLRLIYGLIVGRSGTYGSQEARRKTLLRMLFRMDAPEIVLFLQICLGKLRDVRLADAGTSVTEIIEREVTSPDQRFGYVRMTLSLLTILQSQFAPFGKHVVDAVLYCVLRASLLSEKANSGQSSIERSIRKTGIQCLTMLFRLSEDISWEPYMQHLVAGLVSPKMEAFATENSQSISALLHLYAAWSQESSTVAFLTSYDDRVLPAVFATMGNSATKAEVKVFILNEILLPLLANGKETLSQNAAKAAVQDHLSLILDNMAALLSSAPTADVLKATATALLELAPLTGTSGGIEAVMALLVDLLSTSKHRLSPAVKSSVLGAISALLQSTNGELDPATFDKLFGSVSSLFSYFKDQPNRQMLGGILQTMSKGDKDLLKVSRICQDLNAVSSQRLEEVDFDRRLSAFQQVSSQPIEQWDPKAWKPVLFNLLFYSHDEDFSIRSNAVSSLRSFINHVAIQDTAPTQGLLREIVLPALQKGLTSDSEVVRADQVSLFGLLVQCLHDDRLKDMQALLVGNDEEASFFANILHIQQHRRLRAVRRLVTEAEKGTLTTASISQTFIPLLSKFIRDPSPDDSAQTVKGQALVAMKVLLQWVNWKQFKAIFKQYKVDLEGEEGVQKTAIKMLGQAADALLTVWEQKQLNASDSAPESLSHLAKSLPEAGVFAGEVKDQLLSKLGDFVHYKDETDMSARLPAATVAVKLTKLLSPEDGQIQSAPIVLDVANVLRSRAQESRDAGRSVLVDIVVLLGAGSMQFVLRQLRSALQRGYQLHVLSYTMHSILVALSPTLQISDLDYCTSDLVAVIMDDIFGAVGQEKDNEDYISSMREVKRNKSFDSMELIARSTSLDHLSLLIQPTATLLSGSLGPRQVRKVDELMRRLGIGVAQNPQAGDRGLLVFAYQTIQSFYKEKAAPVARTKTLAERNRERFLIQKSASSATGPRSFLLFKVARFAIDLVRSALVKHSSLMTPENVHGFLPVIGDALIEGQEDVKISALRLLAAVIKLPMPELDENGPLYVAEAVKVVKNCTNTNEEAAQAALKLVAAVLRERKSVQVRDFDIAEVLKRITPDLEDPDRQGVTFNFIRAVLARKYQLPEVYEAVDKIAVMMVTSQARGARDLSRGVYVHFLIEYPQSSSRWAKQQKFLIKNLEYDYPEGRQSVMEAINTLTGKLQRESAQQLVSAFFVPIVLRMANDDHEGCRELAGALLGQLFTKADQERTKGLLEPLQGWIDQEDNLVLLKLSLQAYSVFFRAMDQGFEEHVRLVRTRIAGLLQAEPTDESDAVVSEALQLFAVLVSSRPAAALSNKAEGIWESVRGHLSRSQASVRRSAAELIEAFLGSCQPAALSQLPLTNTHGLRWSESALQDLLKGCTRIIKNNVNDPELNNNIKDITVLLATAASNSGLTMPLKNNSDADDIDSSGDDEEEEMLSSEARTTSIPATQYLLDQLAYILRRETSTLSTSAFLPKTTGLALLSTLTDALPGPAFHQQTLTRLLTPLIYLTSNDSGAPYSADPTFATTYAALTTSASEAMSALQECVGDAVYVKAMTSASRSVREKREERRRKRKVERVADPEAAARRKRRMGDKKKERRREIGREEGMRRTGRGF